MWLRVDDNFISHQKVTRAADALGKGGLGRVLVVWMQGMSHASKHLTNGFLDRGTVARFHDEPKPLTVAEALVRVGLWEGAEGGYQIHDYLQYNLSSDTVQESHEYERRRKELYAIPGLVDAVRQRDQDQCRYCGITVKWRDRKGPTGGRYTRIEPDGANTLDNVVVICRRCSAVKDTQPPMFSGLKLLTAPEQIWSESGPGLDSDQIRTRSESSPEGTPDTSESGPGLDSFITTSPSPSPSHPLPIPSVSRHTAHAPAAPAGKPLAYRPRIDVAWPGRPPVPGALHAEFVEKLGGDDREESDKRLRAWYPVAAAAWADQPIGDDDFRFWRARFREWIGTTARPLRPGEARIEQRERDIAAFLNRPKEQLV